jgi:hypothetical protein
MKKLKNWLETKLNSIKGYVAFIILSAGVITITMVYFVGVFIPSKMGIEGLISYQVRYMPINEAKASTNAILSVLDGTKMEDAKPYILKASKYYEIPIELYLGIAKAESGFNNFPEGSFNPVGIKPEGQLKNYNSWEHSVNATFHLLKEYYWESGLTTCREIMLKYVGYQSEDWVNNCQSIYLQ